MNYQCIAYVTDENYFFPTAVSALQARKFASKFTDIVIVTTEVAQNKEIIKSFCRDNDIVLVDGSRFLAERFTLIDRREFSGRVSISAMGRLLLSDLLPGHYRQVIYIDGDTQIVDDLAPLERFEVPAGKILAALDYVSIVQAARGEVSRPYFNSGVLKFDRTSWIGPAAFDYFVRHGGHLHDQGALNTVAGDALILMSSRWNFPKQFLHLAGGQRPAIVHFAAHPKPWDGVFFPCSHRESAAYEDVLRENACLRLFVRKISLARWCVYKLRSLKDRIVYRLPFFAPEIDQGALQRIVMDWRCDEALFAAASMKSAVSNVSEVHSPP